MKRIALGFILLFFAIPAYAQEQDRNTDGNPPAIIVGTYETTYYANFSDWEIFPVLLPMTNADPTVLYENRFDLTPEGQIIGLLEGEVKSGVYRIDLPDFPGNTAWYDTDGDPSTKSPVKVFLVGTGSGMVGRNHVSRYDFIYTRSFGYDPNLDRWSGSLVVWSTENDASFPILNGADQLYYTEDDLRVTVPKGWSIVEINEDEDGQNVRVYQTSQPRIDLSEPNHLQSVDLRHLDYEHAFLRLTEELERTYAFTDYREVDWEDIRTEFAPRTAAATNEYEFQRALESALFSFRDGHLSITGAGLPDWYWGRLGMKVFPVNNELVVMETYTVSPVGGSPIIPGTVITAVNGKNALTYFSTVPRMIFSGGHESEDRWLRGDIAFRGEPGTPYTLDYRLPDGTVGSVTLETDALRDISGGSRIATSLPLYYGIHESGVGFVGIMNFTSSQIDDLWDDAMNLMENSAVPGIIIDLRSNGGGFSAISNYILGDFLDDDIYSGREVSNVDKNGDGITDIREEFYYGRQRRFDASHVVVLVGPDCFSACEFAALGFQDIGATVMGHLPTGGAGGGVGASYFLPGNTYVYGMAVVRSEDPDGNIVIEGTGVELDVQVPFSISDLASGEDTLMLAAEAFLLNQ